jgi:signal transduction histidine kinase
MPAETSFLRQVALFANLSEADINQICQDVELRQLAQGETLFSEGSIGQDAYIIKEGQIEIYKTVEAKRVRLAVRGPGEVIGEMALLEASPRSASGQALENSLVVVISHTQLDSLLNRSPTASRSMLATITRRLRDNELLLRQSEKMAQLGTLMAGIAHELNNPAAAVGRSSKQLSDTLVKILTSANDLEVLHLTSEELASQSQKIKEKASHPVQIGSLERSDREAEIEEWLEEHEIADGWKLSPPLASLFEGKAALQMFVKDYPPAILPALMVWVVTGFEIYNLLDEVSQGARRISEIVKALKSYVYLDQAPVQEVDLHEGLENTLVILRHKLKGGIEVVREYGPSLPPVLAYGSELNQVWTNIIDNAIDAMDGKGRLTIRTSYEEPWVTVMIEDTGPGIPENVQANMFNPFFTTKPVGKGTGLGLNITYNIVQKHKGDIQVSSKPGETRFFVRIPVNFEQLPH